MSQINKLGLLLFLLAFSHVQDGGWEGGIAVIIVNISALMFLVTPKNVLESISESTKLLQTKWDFKEDVEIFTEEFWYDLTEGGYIKPEYLLTDKKQVANLQTAIDVVRSFECAIDELRGV